MRIGGVLLVTVALLAGACTGGATDSHGDKPPRGHGDGPGPTLPPSVGDCIGTPPAPPKDVKAVLARPGAWLRVEGLAFSDTKRPRTVELRRYGRRFHVLGGDRAMVDRLPATVETIYALNATAYAIDRALQAGATVTVHTGGHGDPREVTYAVATLGSQAAFVGECATKTLMEPFRELYAGESWRYLDAIVGKPAAEIARLLDVPVRHARYLLGDPEFRRVGDLPQGLDGHLDRGWLTVRAAASWDGPVRVCSRIEYGRGDCVTLRGEYTNKTRVRLWYDPANPRVEIAVYDTALGRRIATLVTFDLERLARAAGFDASSRNFVVRLDLAATPSLADVTAVPSLGPKAASVRIAPCAVNRCTV